MIIFIYELAYDVLMARIVLITCVNKKLKSKAPACELYISPLFRFSLAYARTFDPDKIFILSAKHHLLGLDEVIEPYNKTLNNMSVKEIKEWSDIVVQRLRKVADLDDDEFIFLSGEKYMKYILPYVKNYKIPLKGLSFGKRLQFMKNRI